MTDSCPTCGRDGPPPCGTCRYCVVMGNRCPTCGRVTVPPCGTCKHCVESAMLEPGEAYCERNGARIIVNVERDRCWHHEFDEEAPS